MSDGLIVKTVQLSFHEAYAQYLDEAELGRIVAAALFDADIPAERIVFLDLGPQPPLRDGLTAYARNIQAEAEAGLARDDLPPDTVPGTAPTPRRPTDE